MDNASFHKGMLMKKAIEDAGHTLLYLPPYSPDPYKDILASACGFQWIVDSILNATLYKY
ncbi:MAG: transposase [Alphaproteobacteria bacterium]